MTLKQGIEKHLEGKTLDPKIIVDDICEFITEKARKYLDGVSGAIDDATVFGWVDSFITTDYVKFYEDKEKENKKVEKKKEKPVIESKVNENKQQITLNKPEQIAADPLTKEIQLSLFGGELDETK